MCDFDFDLSRTLLISYNYNTDKLWTKKRRKLSTL